MIQRDSNIGIKGPASVRLGGRTIENLPIAEGVRAKAQMPEVYKTDKKNKIAAIKNKYPPGSIPYYRSRDREARDNITRISNYSKTLRGQISEYVAQMSMCDFRDKEIDSISGDDSDRDKKIRDLKLKFPPYDVKAMKQQIKQFEEGIERCDGVIAQENDSIAELREAMGLAKRRDLELKNLGEG